MINNSRMMKLVNSLILENKLNDIFRSIAIDDNIIITKDDGEQHAYKVMSNIANRIIMRDLSEDSLGTEYVIDSNSLVDDVLTIWAYDKKSPTTNFKGEEFNFNITDMVIIKDDSGSKYKVDVIPNEDDFRSKENANRLNEYNDLISKLNKGDTLVITTDNESNEDGGDSIVNDLFFYVNNVDRNWYELQLNEVRGNVDGEVAYPNNKLKTITKNNFIYIGGRHGFFKIGNSGSVIIDMFIGKRNGKNITIKNIIDVTLSDIEKDLDYDTTTGKFSKKDLMNDLLKEPTFKSMLYKNKSLKDTLIGASPLGLMQLKNMMQKYKTKNSYLTKGNVVKIKLLSSTIPTSDLRRKLSNDSKRSYIARVSDENTLRVGTGTNFFEIKILDEIEDNTYKTEVSFCESNGTCTKLTNDSIIKILTNE